MGVNVYNRRQRLLFHPPLLILSSFFPAVKKLTFASPLLYNYRKHERAKLLVMKRVLYLEFLILFLLSLITNRAFCQNRNKPNETDREKVKKFAEANKIIKAFEEILPAKFEEIKREFKYKSFSDSPTVYYDEQGNLVLFTLKNVSLSQPDFSKFEKLEILALLGCSIKKDAPSLSLPNLLTMLDLSWSVDLSSIDFSGLINLEKLNLPDCNINELKPHKLPHSLSTIILSRNTTLQKVDLSSFKNLQVVDLNTCGITDLTLKESKFPLSLTTLHLSHNGKLGKPHLSGLKNLEKLYLSDCKITGLVLSDLPKLDELDLKNNGDLKEVDLSNIEKLIILNLTNCGLADIDCSNFPRSLTYLYLDGNTNLEDVDFKDIEKLKILYLSYCSNLKKLNFSNLPGLTEIYLKDNGNLTSVNLEELLNLEKLDLSTAGFNMAIEPGPGKAHIEITKIEIQLEKNGRSSIGFFDENTYKDCFIKEDKLETYAKMEIEYSTKGPPVYSTMRAAELNKDPILDITWFVIRQVGYPGLFYIGIGVFGLISILICSQSVKLHKFLRSTGWRKIFAFFIWLLVFLWSNFRFRLLSPFTRKLLTHAKLNQFSQEEYFKQLEVVEIIDIEKELEGVPQPIITALGNIEGVIVLRGRSGLGKTMFFKYLIMQLKENAAQNKKVPVFLPASQCKEGVFKAIASRLTDSLIRGEETIKELINKKTMAVFIDGLNEVAPDTLEKINNFIDSCDNGDIWVSTQPIRWEPPSGSKVYELKPIKEEQIKDFLLLNSRTYKGEINVSPDEYKQRCRQWITREKAKLSNHDFENILGNPLELSTAAQLLLSGEKPGDIDVFNLQQQQYDIMAKKYKKQYNENEFRLNTFSKEIYQWLRETNYLYLPDDPIIKKFHPELEVMKSFKMVLHQEDMWSFRHEKIKIFFLVKAFQIHKYWKIKENFTKDHFKDVFPELAKLLSIPEIEELRKLLKKYGKESGDNTLLQEYLKHLQERKDKRETQ
jgi:uncharacterized protein YjbI with pentapeptide repeats